MFNDLFAFGKQRSRREAVGFSGAGQKEQAAKLKAGNPGAAIRRRSLRAGRSGWVDSGGEADHRRSGIAKKQAAPAPNYGCQANRS